MHRPDDDLPDLHDQLLTAIGAEPPMASLPEDDLTRGRRLARRRRWTAVGAAATLVPAMTLGAYAVSASLDDPAGTPTLQPAGSPEGGASENAPDPSGLTAECEVSGTPSTGRSGTMIPVGPDPEGATETKLTARASDGGRSAARVARAGPGVDLRASAGSGAGSRGAGSGSTLGSIEPLPGDCLAVVGDPGDTAEIDRITEALTGHVDPDGSHAGMSIAGGAVNEAGETTGIYVGQEWADRESTGMVSLSVEAAAAGNGGSCLDPSIVGGPEVTCESRTLGEGATVLVGRGVQNGSERISVQYTKPDGTLVWATADAATEQWWEDGSGAEPLPAAPATVDQLIDLVLDDDVHL